MLAILNSLNAHNFPIFQPILMILVSKLMVHRALSDLYLLLGLLSHLTKMQDFRWLILSYFFYPTVQRAWHMLILSPICYRKFSPNIRN